MKTLLFFLATLVLSSLLSLTPAVALELECGDIFPTIEFENLDSAEDKEYLGLGRKGSFEIADIETDVVIIELFSMYCPHCQAEAPLTREIFNLIEEDTGLKGRFKIIGIGINNTEFEVEVFKEKYDIPFPLIPDIVNIVQGAIGKVYTPHYIVVVIEVDRTLRVVFSETGRLNDPKEFIDMIVELVKGD